MSEVLLRQDSALQLGGCFRELLEKLPDVGNTYIQGRNAGGGLGKAVPEFRPIVLEGESIAIDPRVGIGFSLSEWIAVHGGLLSFDVGEVPALDFEFACFTSGLSFLEIPGLSEVGSIQAFANRFECTRIGAVELGEWRNNIEGPLEICECCQKASQNRARKVVEHPLYEICRQATNSGIELRCRLQARHVDFVVDLVPSRLSTSNGFLVVLPEVSEAAWHIDMRMVHSLRISKTVIDGNPCGQLEIFDMFGNRNFLVTCEEPGIDLTWRAICEGEIPG